MKVFLLAAGKGTRLQPLTFHTPKCLVPICGKPLIEYWFDLFDLYGIDEVLINTSHLAEKVEDYINNNLSRFKIKLVHEETLLGSGGTIKKNRDFVEGEESFFIFYADNLTNINLGEMLKFHEENKRDFTLAIFKVPNPRECGIVELDAELSIISFIEKPENPVSNLAFAGIMLGSPGLMDLFPDRDVFDLGHDVLPRVAGNAAGYIMDDYLLDIGTPEKLTQAEKDVKNGKIKFSRKLKSGGLI
ncbi:MAG TPA: nucleotidyltransferase family protein [Nitrospirae bacterium]|nr:D-glycero-alpha-D-manno-heptose 1-phosphate guanylyltransferase [bacterium BMS3Abin06]HDH12746.1 nucleotidyltransferase family protein [Nitrospirota bacterium]HDZ00055.1 nucleotidyltransferase family protein [Nitrospirota bacterium]